jgi:hypothetical protein
MKINLKWNGSELLMAAGTVCVSLKLLGHIDWSWWLVTIPFWIIGALVSLPVLFGFGIVGGFCLILLIDHFNTPKKGARRK